MLPTVREGPFVRLGLDGFARSANASEPRCCGPANITCVILYSNLGEEGLIR